MIVGPLQTNCYILIENDECLIIDPGDDENKIIHEIGNCKPIGIIITHYHFDHINALKCIKEKYHIPVYDINNIGVININSFDFEIIDTKGHDNTCITVYFKKNKLMFTGDFIFKDSIGRTDFEGSSIEDMKKSIKNIVKYPDDITIYPGHGEMTNLGNEKNNYFLRNMI